MLYIKLMWMYAAAMAATVFVYPFLHEMGHYITAVLLGADVVGVGIFPLPYVALLIEDPMGYRQAAIGFSGLLFPMISFLIKAKGLSACTVIVTLRVVNMFAWLMSGVSVLCFALGYKWNDEDMVKVIESLGGYEAVILLVCVVFCLLCGCVLIRDKPINRMLSFFE